MKPSPVIVVFTLGVVLILFTTGSSLVYKEKSYSWLSTSPLNPGPGGTSSFVEDLGKRYNVVLGNTSTLGGIKAKATYIIIGPDTQLNDNEIEIIVKLVKAGHLNLLIADETSNTKSLLRALGLPSMDGTVYNETVKGGGWEFMVKIVCDGYEAWASRAVRVPRGPGGEEVCSYKNDGAAAVLYNINGSRVLVVGDSSIFANYLYNGYGGLKPSRNVALFLARLTAGDSRVNPVIVDNKHYLYMVKSRGAYPLTGLWTSLASSLDRLEGRARELAPLTLALVLVVASVPWPLILLTPWNRPKRKSTPLRDATIALLEVEASRLGVEEGPGQRDPESLASRIVRRARKLEQHDGESP
ncbi:MAG: hypothetical protein F7C33_03780 [Desulfurococcales archaeon]|nr:hypothetical protein [Desulfurococcales archaeon]